AEAAGDASAAPQASSHSSSASSRRGPGVARAWARGAGAACVARGGRASAVITADAHQQRMQAPCVGTRDAEAEAAERQFLPGVGQVPDRRGDQASDGVVFVVVEVGAEAL